MKIVFLRIAALVGLFVLAFTSTARAAAPKLVEDNGIFYVTATTTGLTGTQWIDRLERKGIYLPPNAQRTLMGSQFVPGPAGKVLRIAILTNKNVPDSEWNPETRNLKAERYSLSEIDVEAACLILDTLTVPDFEKMGIVSVAIMHKPIPTTESRITSRLAPQIVEGRLWLGGGLVSFDGGQEANIFFPSSAFAYLAPATEKK